MPVRNGGDCYDRYLIRMEEVGNPSHPGASRGAVSGEGETMGKVPRVIRPPEGEVYSGIESPRGEIGCYIISRGKARAFPSEIPQTFIRESANFAEAAGR